MSERMFLSPPDVTEAEEHAVVRAIRSGWVARLGPEVDAFEKELAELCGRSHAVALSSGTAALHLSLLALGVRPGDVVTTATMRGRNAMTWQVRLAANVEYVNKRSLILDLHILLTTLLIVLRRHGISAHGEAAMAEFAGRKDVRHG